MAYTDPSPGPGPAATIGGIATALLLFIALMFGPLFVWAWSGAHCDPVPACQQASDGGLGRSAALAAVPAVLLGVAMRSLFHWLWRRLEADAPPRRGPTPWWAFAAVPLTIWAGTWLVWL